MEQIKKCVDCPHYESCQFKHYIDNPERTFQLEMSTPSKTEGELIMNQIKTVVNMAPNDCPRYKGSKFDDRLAAACVFGYLSIAMDAAFKEQHPYKPQWPHQPPCQKPDRPQSGALLIALNPQK